MAGLLFAITHAPAEAGGLVEQALPNMLHFPWLKVHRFDQAHFSLALILPDELQPTLWHESPDGSLVVAHGEYYPNDERITDPGHAATQIRQRLELASGGALTSENGLFNLVAWEAEQRVCHVVNDVSGALLLFRGQRPGAYVFASEPGAVNALTAGRVDRVGLTSLLQIGYQADHRTIIEGVEVLPASSVFRYEIRERQVLEARGEFTLEPSRVALPTRDYVSLVETSVALRCADTRRLCLPLSGGDDSRLLAGVASRLGLPLEAITSESCQIWDAKVGAEVAARLGLPHHVIPMQASALVDDLDLMRSTFSGTADWHGSWYLPMLKAVPRGSSIVLGFLGGALAGANVQRNVASEGCLLQQAQSHYRYGRGVGQHVRAATERVALQPERMPFQSACLPELVTNLYGRQRRYASLLLRLAWNFGRPACPYTDRRVVAHARSLSRRELTGRRLQRQALCSAFPELGRMTSANDLLAPSAHRLRALRRLLQSTAISRVVRRRMPWFPRTYDAARLRPMLDQATRLLDRSCHAVFDRWQNAGSPFGGLALLAVLASNIDPALVENLLAGRHE
jgi:asparagine synthase (glutamine-hydrolysing)